MLNYHLICPISITSCLQAIDLICSEKQDKLWSVNTHDSSLQHIKLSTAPVLLFHRLAEIQTSKPSLLRFSWNKEPYHKTVLLDCSVTTFISRLPVKTIFIINNGVCAFNCDPLTAVIWQLQKMKRNINMCNSIKLNSLITQCRNSSRACTERLIPSGGF